MSFLNALPLPVLILLGFALLGFYDCLKKLYTYRTKINMFSDYRGVLAEFHNKVREDRGIDLELSDYLLENALKINKDSIIHIRTSDPVIGDPITGISTGVINVINDIVTLRCYDFTGTCKNLENVLTQNIGAFKDRHQKTRSQIINPVSLVKNGVFLILNRIPIVNLIPTNLKNLLIKIFLFISAIETLLSLFSQKSLLLSIIRQITEWIS